MKIYEGYGTPVEVSDELYKELSSLDKQWRNSETRHHRNDHRYFGYRLSLEDYIEHGHDVTDDTYFFDSDITLDFQDAFMKLTKRQKALIIQVRDGFSFSEIARENNIDESAVRHAYRRALKCLQKIH